MILTMVIICAAVVVVDLVTKYTIPGILNPGIAWGFGAQWPWLWVVIVIFSFIITGLFVVWYWRTPKKSWWLTVGLGLFLGGVLGNAIDRLITGGPVHDFIDFEIFKNNIADIMVIIGAAIVGVKLALR